MANPFDDPRDYGTVSGQSTGFRRDEYSRLHQKVANGVQEIKKLIRSLQRLTDQVGTSTDNDTLRKRVLTTKQSAIAEVGSTQSCLQELLRVADQQEQQLSSKSLFRQLEQATSECEEAIRGLKHKLEQFPTPPPPPMEASRGYLDSGEVNVTDDRAHLLRTAVTMEQEFVVSNEVEETEARAHAMQELEEDIVGLHTVMQDLGVMVESQGEVVDNLETNVEKASSDVVHANEQLGRAVVYKKCSRKLCCVIATILIIVFLIIVAVVAIVAAVLSKK